MQAIAFVGISEIYALANIRKLINICEHWIPEKFQSTIIQFICNIQICTINTAT